MRITAMGATTLRVLSRRTEFLAFYERACRAFRQQQFDDAVELFTQAVDLDPDDPAGHRGLGAACAFTGDFEQAITHFRLACELRPGDARGYINQGGLLNMTGNFREAVLVLRQGLRRVGDDADLYFNLGITYRHLDQPDMAIACYRESLKLRPAQANAHLNLANIFVRSQDPGRALDHYTMALRIDPQYERAQIGRLYVNSLLAGEDTPEMPKSGSGVPQSPPPKQQPSAGVFHSAGAFHSAQPLSERRQRGALQRTLNRNTSVSEHFCTTLLHRVRPALLLLGQLAANGQLDDPVVRSAAGQLREEASRLVTLIGQLAQERRILGELLA